MSQALFIRRCTCGLVADILFRPEMTSHCGVSDFIHMTDLIPRSRERQRIVRLLEENSVSEQHVLFQTTKHRSSRRCFPEPPKILIIFMSCPSLFHVSFLPGSPEIVFIGWACWRLLSPPTPLFLFNMQMQEKLQIKGKSPNKWLISRRGIQTEPTTAEQAEQTTVSGGRDTNVRILRCANVHFVVPRRHSWQARWGFCVFVKAHICVYVHASAVFLFSPCVPRCTSERTPLMTRSVGYFHILLTWLVL